MRRWFLVCVSCLLLASCTAFSSKRRALVNEAASGNYDAALSALDHVQSHNPTLLDLLDRGTILHFKGDYKSSNQTFDASKNELERLEVVSVSREASTWLINDLTQAYSGEEYEKIWVNIMKAFNYMLSDSVEEALVEIRQIDRALQVYADRCGPGWKFRNHAFANYLSGILHESVGEWNDAHVSYRKALAGYEDYERLFNIKMPLMLQKDVLRSAEIQGFSEEARLYRGRFPQAAKEVSADNRLKPKEIFLIIAFGKIAHKEERFWDAALPNSGLLRVAYPAYAPTPFVLHSADVEYDGQHEASAIVEDLSGIAAVTLSDRMALIKGRAIARMVAKAGVSAGAGVAVARETKDPGLGALTAIFTNMLLNQTERADTRSWLTLPAEIHFVRIPLKPGTKGHFDFKVNYKDGRGSVIYSEPLDIEIGAELKTFVFLRAKEP